MPDLSKQDKTKLGEGIHYAYPSNNQTKPSEKESNTTEEMTLAPLEDLMSKLKNL